MREQQLALVPILLRTSGPAGAGGDTPGTAKDTRVGAEFLCPTRVAAFPRGTQVHGGAGAASLCIQEHGDTDNTYVKEKGEKPRGAPPLQAEILQEARGDPAPVQMFLLPCCPFERLKHLAASEGVPEALPNESRDTPPPPRRDDCTDIFTRVHTQTHVGICIFYGCIIRTHIRTSICTYTHTHRHRRLRGESGDPETPRERRRLPRPSPPRSMPSPQRPDGDPGWRSRIAIPHSHPAFPSLIPVPAPLFTCSRHGTRPPPLPLAPAPAPAGRDGRARPFAAAAVAQRLSPPTGHFCPIEGKNGKRVGQ